MLKKKVNGKEVICSEIEESAFRNEWATNEQLRIEKVSEEERKRKVRDQSRKKIFDLLQLSEEEASLLF